MTDAFDDNYEHKEDSKLSLSKGIGYSSNGPLDVSLYHNSKTVQFHRFISEKRFQILHPYMKSQLGIMLGYFNVGLSTQLLSAPITYYLINDLQITSFQFGAYTTLKRLPWTFKFLFGLLSDQLPIFGYKRKSYFLVAWIIYIVIGLYLSIGHFFSYFEVTVAMFIMTGASVCSYSMCETMVAERAKFEPEKIKGFLQTSGSLLMSFGVLLGATIGTLVYNYDIWGWGLSISGMLVMVVIVPFVSCALTWWDIIEINKNPTILPSSLYDSYLAVWNTLQLNAAWYPLSFLYLYYVFQVPNTAWTNFLVLGLGFNDFDLGSLSILSGALYWATLLVYKKYFYASSWRVIFLQTTVLSVLFSSLQIMLILRFNLRLGIPDMALALGDTVVTTAIFAVQSLPGYAMFSMIVPEGHEAVTFGVLTSVTSIAWTVAQDIGSQLVIAFGISNEDLVAHDFDSLLRLEILTTCLQLFPLLFVWMLPDNKESQTKLRDSQKKSVYGGALIAFLFFGSFILTILFNIYIAFFK